MPLPEHWPLDIIPPELLEIGEQVNSGEVNPENLDFSTGIPTVTEEEAEEEQE